MALFFVIPANSFVIPANPFVIPAKHVLSACLQAVEGAGSQPESSNWTPAYAGVTGRA